MLKVVFEMVLVVGDLEWQISKQMKVSLRKKAVNIIFPQMQYHLLGGTKMINISFCSGKLFYKIKG